MVKDAESLGISIGGTNMLAMLWTIAMDRLAFGVDNRDDLFRVYTGNS